MLVEHRVVHVELAVPDALFAPVRRRCHYRVVVRRRRVGIARRAPEGRVGIRDRVEDRQVVRAELGRAVDFAVGVDGRITSVRRRQIVQITFLGGPVPYGRDDVSLEPLRTRRCLFRHLASGDAIGPVGEILERHTGQLLRQRADHLLARLTGLHAPDPGLV